VTTPTVSGVHFARQVFSRKDLAELQRRLSEMSVTAVQDFYRTAYLGCRFDRPVYSRAGSGLEADTEVAFNRLMPRLRTFYPTSPFSVPKPEVLDAAPSHQKATKSHRRSEQK